MAKYSLGRLTVVITRYFNKEQQREYRKKGFSRKTIMLDADGEYDGVTFRRPKRQWFFGWKRKKLQWPRPQISNARLPFEVTPYPADRCLSIDPSPNTSTKL